MKKQNYSTPKNQMFSKLQACKISKQDQQKIKGGSGDSIIIEDDMII